MAFLIKTNSIEYDGKGFGRGALEYNIYGVDSLTFTRAGNGSSIDKPPVKYSNVINPSTGVAFVSLSAFIAYLDANFFKAALTPPVGGLTYAGDFTITTALTNNFPTTGTGKDGVIKKRDLFRMVNTGTLRIQESGFITLIVPMTAGDLLLALQDAPTALVHWAIIHTSVTQEQLTDKENISAKNQANGYAGLDANGRVPVARLPSYVDTIVEYATLAAFPATGASGTIYVANNTSKSYRWSGTAYREIVASPGTTDALTEGATNKYFTETRVLDTKLAGWANNGSYGTITANTKIRTAIQYLWAYCQYNEEQANTGIDTSSFVFASPSPVDGVKTITGQPLRFGPYFTNNVALQFDTSNNTANGSVVSFRANGDTLEIVNEGNNTGIQYLLFNKDFVIFQEHNPRITPNKSLGDYTLLLESYSTIRLDYLEKRLKDLAVTMRDVPAAVMTAVKNGSNTWTAGDLTACPSPTIMAAAVADMYEGKKFEGIDANGAAWSYHFGKNNSGDLGWSRNPKA